MRPETPDLDPVSIIRALDKYGVRYVIVGGYGATAHGVPLPELTTDIDFSPERSAENLAAFVAALEELGATNLIPEAYGTDRPPFFDDPQMILRRRFWTLVTPHGPIDLVVAPDGIPNGYDTLITQAVVLSAVTPDGAPLPAQIVVASVRHIALETRSRPDQGPQSPASAHGMGRERDQGGPPTRRQRRPRTRDHSRSVRTSQPGRPGEPTQDRSRQEVTHRHGRAPPKEAPPETMTSLADRTRSSVVGDVAAGGRVRCRGVS